MFVATLCFAVAFGDPTSGPAVGDKLADVTLQAFTGPQAGKSFGLLGDIKDRPTLLVFVQKMTRPTLQLLRPVDDFAGKNDKLAAHIVFVTADEEKTNGFLKRAKEALNLQAPIAVGLEGKNGFEKLGLNDMVGVTILVLKDQKVVANIAIVDPNGTDARRVIQAAKKAVGE